MSLFYHIKTVSTFDACKVSANENNTKYTLGAGNVIYDGEPDIQYNAIVFIRESCQIWTHGQMYERNVGNIDNVDIATEYDIKALFE